MLELEDVMKLNETPSAAIEADGTPVIDRRSLLVGLSLVGGAAFSYLMAPRAKAAPIPEEEFQDLIPAKVGGWTSRNSNEVVLPAEDDLEAKLYENLETRIYEGNGLPSVMMLIAYSSVQENDVQVHRPEVCYPVAGYPILTAESAVIEFGSGKIDARELVADRGGIRERILYWVRVGDEFPVGWLEQRLIMAKKTLLTGFPDGLLFRVSTLEDDSNYTPLSLRIFMKAFFEASSEAFKKKVLVG